MAKQRFGGSFAPPLTDAILAHYTQLVDGLDPKSQVGDWARYLLACVKAWWEEPESTGEGRPHPSGRGIIIDLDSEIAKRLFDAIPWKDELKMMQAVFDGVQVEEARRNGDKLEAWRLSLRGAIYDSVMPQWAKDFAASPAGAQYREVLAALQRVDDKTYDMALRAVFEAFSTGSYDEWVECSALVQKTFEDEIRGTPRVPKPALESTELRDMLFHLLWHATELELDREPLTNDKL